MVAAPAPPKDTSHLGPAVFFHEAFARELAAHDVDHVFGVVGDGNLYLMDSFRRLTGGAYHSVSHEAAAVLAANGFARVSGRLGVATVTHGPALTNTVTALIEGVRGRTPLLLVAGDTAATDKNNFQNIGQAEVLLGTGAGFEQVRTPDTLREDLGSAIRQALVERRPVVLNLPVDFQWALVEDEGEPRRPATLQASWPDPAAVDAAVAVLATARRPVVLAGRGAISPAARKALLRFAARLGAPVATSLLAKDLFRGEEADLGICGGLAHPVARTVIAESNCIVAFGAGLNSWTTDQGALLSGKRVIHVDRDPGSIGRYHAVDVAVVGDAAAVADSLVTALDQAGIPPTGFARPEFDEGAVDDGPAEPEGVRPAGTVDIRSALARLEKAMPDDRTLVLDGGRFVKNCFTMMHVPDPAAFVYTVHYGSIGLGMGNAIGAWFGAPSRPVLLVSGDGGFMLGGLAEFATAVRHRMDLVVVVLNDGAYGAEHVQLRRRDMDPSISMFDWPDLGPVATALGGRGFTVRSLSDLDDALAALPTRDRPVLIDIKVDPDSVEAAW